MNVTRPVILAVDDAADSLSLISDILEEAGMTALAAKSGNAALTLLARTKPDAILMDAVMPGMDGFETTKRIKEDGALSHIPVLFMTGLSDTESVVKGFEAGGVDYITKPIVPDELLARLRVHLSNSRLAQSARMALDISGTPLLAVEQNGKLRWMTPEAMKLVGDALEAPTTNSILSRVVMEKLSRAQLPGGKSGELLASYVGEARPGEHLVRLSGGSVSGDKDLLCRRFNLTAREAEVLLWIAQGKSNRDVAEILDCSPRTVNKHLEQIFENLQVENRTAAAMLAMRVLTRA